MKRVKLPRMNDGDDAGGGGRSDENRGSGPSTLEGKKQLWTSCHETEASV